MENYEGKDIELTVDEPERSDFIPPVPAAEATPELAAKIEESAEYDLLGALLKASEFKSDEDEETEIRIERNGKFLFKFKIHPLSDEDIALARKKATKYYPNPNGRKLPKVPGETNYPLLNSWMIYLATSEKDQKDIWGNRAFMNQKGITMPVESIDALLKSGEKTSVLDEILEISGLAADEEDFELSAEDYAKN